MLSAPSTAASTPLPVAMSSRDRAGFDRDLGEACLLEDAPDAVLVGEGERARILRAASRAGEGRVSRPPAAARSSTDFPSPRASRRRRAVRPASARACRLAKECAGIGEEHDAETRDVTRSASARLERCTVASASAKRTAGRAASLARAEPASARKYRCPGPRRRARRARRRRSSSRRSRIRRRSPSRRAAASAAARSRSETGRSTWS